MNPFIKMLIDFALFFLYFFNVNIMFVIFYFSMDIIFKKIKKKYTKEPIKSIFKKLLKEFLNKFKNSFKFILKKIKILLYFIFSFKIKYNFKKPNKNVFKKIIKIIHQILAILKQFILDKIKENIYNKKKLLLIIIYFTFQIILCIFIEYCPNNYIYAKELFYSIILSSIFLSIVISICTIFFNYIYSSHIKNTINRYLEDFNNIKILYNKWIYDEIDNIDKELENYSDSDIFLLKNTIEKTVDINKSYILSISISTLISLIFKFNEFSKFSKENDIYDVIYITILAIFIIIIVIVLFIIKSLIFDEIFYYDINNKIYKKLELFLYKKKNDIHHSEK